MKVKSLNINGNDVNILSAQLPNLTAEESHQKHIVYFRKQRHNRAKQ